LTSVAGIQRTGREIGELTAPKIKNVVWPPDKSIVALLFTYDVVINGSHLKKLWSVRNTFRIKLGELNPLGLWKLNDRTILCSNIIRA
jgi:hypothetical protein